MFMGKIELSIKFTECKDFQVLSVFKSLAPSTFSEADNLQESGKTRETFFVSDYLVLKCGVLKGKALAELAIAIADNRFWFSGPHGQYRFGRCPSSQKYPMAACSISHNFLLHGPYCVFVCFPTSCATRSLAEENEHTMNQFKPGTTWSTKNYFCGVCIRDWCQGLSAER